MQTTPHRRWFQYGLRGLFVAMSLLCAFLGWLAWETKFIREREAFLDWTREQTHTLKFVHYEAPHPTLPFWRTWLGDFPRQHILLPYGASDDLIAEAKYLFPEILDIEIESEPDSED